MPLVEDLPDQELNAEPQQVIGANLLVVLYFFEHPEVFNWQSISLVFKRLISELDILDQTLTVNPKFIKEIML